jgi:hypothetical protein
MRLKIHAKAPRIGIHPMISKMTKRIRDVTVDCLAWNMTKRLFFSATRKTIPVMNPRR